MSKTVLLSYVICFFVGLALIGGTQMMLTNINAENDAAAALLPSPSPTVIATNSANTRTVIVEKTLTLTPQKGFTLKSKAKFEVMEEKLRVLVTVDGAGSTPYAANISDGTCAKPQKVRYTLKGVDMGNSDTLLDIPEYEMLKGTVVLVTSTADTSNVLACAKVE